jgi:hypothetical protein
MLSHSVCLGVFCLCVCVRTCMHVCVNVHACVCERACMCLNDYCRRAGTWGDDLDEALRKVFEQYWQQAAAETPRSANAMEARREQSDRAWKDLKKGKGWSSEVRTRERRTHTCCKHARTQTDTWGIHAHTHARTYGAHTCDTHMRHTHTAHTHTHTWGIHTCVQCRMRPLRGRWANGL